MKLDEFKAAVAAKTDAVKNPDTPDADADSCLADAVGAAASLFRRTPVNPQATDPSFWLTIIQLIVPLLLEWINRRFPKSPVKP